MKYRIVQSCAYYKNPGTLFGTYLIYFWLKHGREWGRFNTQNTSLAKIIPLLRKKFDKLVIRLVTCKTYPAIISM